MKVSLSLDEAVANLMQTIAKTAGTSASSVAEIALKRLFSLGSKDEIAKIVIAEGGTPRRHTGKTWLNAFYSTLRDLVPEGGVSSDEFMGYEVMASAGRGAAPEKIAIQLMEANPPTTGAVHGMRFTATVDSAPTEMVNKVLAWLRAEGRFRAQ